MSEIILIIYTIIISIFQVYCVSCAKEYQIKEETLQTETKKFNYSKKLKIYLGFMLCMNLILSSILCIVYNNNLLYNMKLISIQSLLWSVAYIDFKYMKIPNKILVYGLQIRILLLIVEIITYRFEVVKIVLMEVIMMVIIFVICMLMNLFIKNAIGIGDVKLIMVMALFMGEGGIFETIMVSLIISFFVSLYALIVKKKNKKDVVPFAPSILAGTYLSIFLFGY